MVDAPALSAGAQTGGFSRIHLKSSQEPSSLSDEVELAPKQNEFIKIFYTDLENIQGGKVVCN